MARRSPQSQQRTQITKRALITTTASANPHTRQRGNTRRSALRSGFGRKVRTSPMPRLTWIVTGGLLPWEAGTV